MDRPKIVSVAIRFNGTIYSLPAPNRHHDVFMMIAEKLVLSNYPEAQEEDKGFLDESGRFLNRRQAVASAVVNDQIINGRPRPRELTSEDIW